MQKHQILKSWLYLSLAPVKTVYSTGRPFWHNPPWANHRNPFLSRKKSIWKVVLCFIVRLSRTVPERINLILCQYTLFCTFISGRSTTERNLRHIMRYGTWAIFNVVGRVKFKLHRVKCDMSNFGFTNFQFFKYCFLFSTKLSWIRHKRRGQWHHPNRGEC